MRIKTLFDAGLFENYKLELNMSRALTAKERREVKQSVKGLSPDWVDAPRMEYFIDYKEGREWIEFEPIAQHVDFKATKPGIYSIELRGPIIRIKLKDKNSGKQRKPSEAGRYTEEEILKQSEGRAIDTSGKKQKTH